MDAVADLQCALKRSIKLAVIHCFAE